MSLYARTTPQSPEEKDVSAEQQAPGTSALTEPTIPSSHSPTTSVHPYPPLASISAPTPTPIAYPSQTINPLSYTPGFYISPINENDEENYVDPKHYPSYPLFEILYNYGYDPDYLRTLEPGQLRALVLDARRARATGGVSGRVRDASGNIFALERRRPGQGQRQHRAGHRGAHRGGHHQTSQGTITRGSATNVGNVGENSDSVSFVGGSNYSGGHIHIE